MGKNGFARALFMASAASGALLAQPAAAQEQGANASNSEEIIVTAARREQSLQDTAMAVNAVTAERLDAAGITNTESLQTAVPSLQYSSGGTGSSFLYLRGVGSNVFGTFSDNSVATYLDGAYVPRATVANQELLDIERVEVLRGPQATLYGRNATGGAITLTSAAPTADFTGAADASFGNYGDQRYRAFISGPLGESGVRGRLALLRHVNDGYNTNLVDGSDYGGQDTWAGRLSLGADLGDNLEALLILNYMTEDGTRGTAKSIDANSFPYLPPPFGAGTPFSPDPRASYHNLGNEHPQESYGANLRLTWDVGFAELISVTSLQTYKSGPDFFDLDDSLAPLLEYQGQVEETEFFYQDFLLRSKPSDGRIDWLVGATIIHDETTGQLPTQTPGGFIVTDTETEIEGYALYGELNFHLTDEISAVAGVRYSDESRAGQAIRTVPPGIQLPAVANDRSWDDWSPRFALEYRPSSDLLFYASATHGFKSGAFDPQNPANAAEPESIWSYEIGARTELVDGFILNATAFHYDFTDMQVFSGVVAGGIVQTVLQNAGEAQADGLELEAIWSPNEYVRLGANAAWLDSRFNDGTVLADVANAITFPIPSVNVSDVGGNRMIQAPELTASVFGQWRVPLGGVGNLDLYADYFYQAERYFSAFEDPTLRADSYTLANARITYSPPSESWYVAAYVRNASDELVEAHMSRVRPFGTLVTYTPPEIHGIEIGARF